ncbi:unnamed protein product [Discosporangium mesarthrocarpum]
MKGSGSTVSLPSVGVDSVRAMCRSSSQSSLQRAFVGRLQPTTARAKTKPDVNFTKGGSDFRCPTTFSCLGKQSLSRRQYLTAASPAFGKQNRWYVPGDKFTAYGGQPISALGDQPTSERISAPRTNFGTSTRDSAAKMYAIWSVAQQR